IEASPIALGRALGGGDPSLDATLEVPGGPFAWASLDQPLERRPGWLGRNRLPVFAVPRSYSSPMPMDDAGALMRMASRGGARGGGGPGKPRCNGVPAADRGGEAPPGARRLTVRRVVARDRRRALSGGSPARGSRPRSAHGRRAGSRPAPRRGDPGRALVDA